MRKVPFETGADPAARPFAPDLSLEPRQWKRLIRSEHVHRGPRSDPRTTCLPVVCPSRRLRFGTGYPEGYSRRIATLDVRRDSHPPSIHAWFPPRRSTEASALWQKSRFETAADRWSRRLAAVSSRGGGHPAALGDRLPPQGRAPGYRRTPPRATCTPWAARRSCRAPCPRAPGSTRTSRRRLRCRSRPCRCPP